MVPVGMRFNFRRVLSLSITDPRGIEFFLRERGWGVKV